MPILSSRTNESYERLQIYSSSTRDFWTGPKSNVHEGNINSLEMLPQDLERKICFHLVHSEVSFSL